METELGVMQQELLQVQKEREILDGHRRALQQAAAPQRPEPAQPAVGSLADTLAGPMQEPMQEPLQEPLQEQVVGPMRADRPPGPQCVPEVWTFLTLCIYSKKRS